MGGLPSMLGMAGGFNGSGVSAPSELTDPKQIQDAYKNAQSGLTQQQAFTNAVNPGGQQALQSQQQLLAQLGQGAQGLGPNPALAQLNQSTGQNVSNQAALMAGQRGASANTGLMARQAAQQGAQTQQQAAGQGATLAAQQQIAQQQALAQQQAQMVGQQANATNAYTNAAQNEQSNLFGAQAGVNANRTNMIGQQVQGQQQMVGNIMGGIGSGMGLIPKGAEGGQVFKMADGGAASSIPDVTAGPVSRIGQAMQEVHMPGPSDALAKGAQSFGKGMGGAGSSMFSGPATQSTGTALGSSIKGANAAMPFAQGGKVDVLLSPGERVLSPEKAKAAAQGHTNPMSEGKKVPGKPKVGGAKNDYANDTHKDSLEEGSIVIPRKITMGKNAEKKSMEFVRAVLAKNGKGLK